VTLNLIETEFSESVEEASTDWSILAEKGVEGILQRAARKAADQYGLTLEYEDAYQEAAFIAATRANQARAALAKGEGLFYRWVGQRLRDKVLTEAKHRTQHTSYEANLEAFDPETV
jgi:phage shock protein A